METVPDISIVIISWRMRDFLDSLLASVFRHCGETSFEVIVVDNDSRDGTADMVLSKYSSVRLIRNDRNRGVAGARNQAYRMAKGRYILSIDADTVLRENSAKRMMEFMDATQDAGLCACKLVFPQGGVQLNARRFPTPWSLVLRRLDFLSSARNSRTLKRHEMAEWDRSDVRTVDYVIGACQMIRHRAMDDVGLLDDDIFYGPEDVDYCLRMKKHGWNVYYYPKTSIVHYEQRATKSSFFSRLSWLHMKGVAHLFLKHGLRLGREHAPVSAG